MKKKERNALEDTIRDFTLALQDLQADPNAKQEDKEIIEKKLLELEERYRKKWVG